LFLPGQVTSSRQRRLVGKNKNSSRRVLLVDDEEKVLKFAALKLKLCGYEVITANNGKDAIRLAESEAPDIMLLDVLMPEMDGFEVLRRLRQFSQMPVIVLTAMTGTQEQALSLGASDYITKPFDPDEVIARMDALLTSG